MAILTCACGEQVRVADAAPAASYRCPRCGATIAGSAGPPGQPRTSGLAITSLVLGLATLLCPPVGLVGIILGIMALVGIANSAGQLRGRGLAIAGIALPLVIGLAMIPLAFFGVFEGVFRVREAANRMLSASNMRQIGIAAHNYHNDHMKLPADIVGRDGKPLLSWRVSMLPYMEHDALFKRFRQDEPWDSPHNRALIPEMPKFFRLPSDPEGVDDTPYQYFVGPDTLFPPGGNTTLGRINVMDGSANTILVIEAADKLPWTKPGGIPYDATQPLPRLHAWKNGTHQVLFADCSTRTIKKDFDPAELRKAISVKDGVPNLSKLEP